MTITRNKKNIHLALHLIESNLSKRLDATLNILLPKIFDSFLKECNIKNVEHFFPYILNKADIAHENIHFSYEVKMISKSPKGVLKIVYINSDDEANILNFEMDKYRDSAEYFIYIDLRSNCHNVIPTPQNTFYIDLSNYVSGDSLGKKIKNLLITYSSQKISESVPQICFNVNGDKFSFNCPQVLLNNQHQVMNREFRNLSFSRKMLDKGNNNSLDEVRVNAKNSTKPFAITTNSVIIYDIDNQIRLYKSKLVSNQDKVVIYIHGGGLVFYDQDVFHSLMIKCVEVTNLDVYSLGYNKLPENKIEYLVENLYLQIEFVINHCSSKNIIFVGDSIGGWLALYFSRIFSKKIKIFCSLIYPVLDLNHFFPSYLKFNQGYFLDFEKMLWFKSLSRYFFNSNEFDPLNMQIDDQDQMNIQIFSGGCDVLYDEAIMFKNKYPLCSFTNFHTLPHDFMLYAGFSKTAEEATLTILRSLITR
jgi:acetyl esterase